MPLKAGLADPIWWHYQGQGVVRFLWQPSFRKQMVLKVPNWCSIARKGVGLMYSFWPLRWLYRLEGAESSCGQLVSLVIAPNFPDLGVCQVRSGRGQVYFSLAYLHPVTCLLLPKFSCLQRLPKPSSPLPRVFGGLDGTDCWAQKTVPGTPRLPVGSSSRSKSVNQVPGRKKDPFFIAIWNPIRQTV